MELTLNNETIATARIIGSLRDINAESILRFWLLLGSHPTIETLLDEHATPIAGKKDLDNIRDICTTRKCSVELVAIFKRLHFLSHDQREVSNNEEICSTCSIDITIPATCGFRRLCIHLIGKTLPLGLQTKTVHRTCEVTVWCGYVEALGSFGRAVRHCVEIGPLVDKLGSRKDEHGCCIGCEMIPRRVLNKCPMVNNYDDTASGYIVKWSGKYGVRVFN